MQQLELERLPGSVDLDLSSETSAANFEGSVTSDGALAYLALDNCFHVFKTKSGTCLATCYFGTALHDYKATVTAMKEHVYPNGDRVFLICVHYSATDILHIYNYQTLKIDRSIKLPRKAVCIESFNNNENFTSSPLKHFAAFAAVGFSPGQVLIIDLYVGDKVMSDEVSPFDLEIIDCSSTVRVVRKSNMQLCVMLDLCSCDGRRFSYCEPDGTVVHQYKKNVAISSLRYFPSCDLLAVGYDIGVFQLWAITSPELLFSSEIDQNLPAVRFFQLQFPDDDPRSCIYLWTGYSSVTGSESSMYSEYDQDFAVVIMHQLNFENEHDELLLRTCRAWYRQQLTPDILPGLNSEGFNRSQILSMQVLSRNKDRDTSLISFVWRFDDTQSDPIHQKLQLGIFDLNSWYQAQMPQKLRLLTSQKFCPYLCFYDCSRVMDEEDLLLNFSINSQSIQRYIPFTVPPADFFSFPSSLSFTCMILTERQLLSCKSEGLQITLLHGLEDVDSSIFEEPENLHNACLTAQLLNSSLNVGGVFSKISMCEQLIRVLADHCRSDQLLRIIQDLKAIEENGESSAISYADVVILLWDYFTEMKQNFDKFCLTLFSEEQLEIDDNFRKQFAIYMAVVTCVKNVFVEVCDTENPVLTPTQVSVAVFVYQYYSAVQWLLEMEYLPEFSSLEDCDQDNSFYFPVAQLNQLYEECQSLSPLDQPLLIVLFAESYGLDMSYPPKSFYQLLSSLYLNEGLVDAKAAVMQYLFFDICQILAAVNDSDVSEVVFAPETQKSTSLNAIQGLWFLDKRRLDRAKERFLNFDVSFLPKALKFAVMVRFFVHEDFSTAYSLIKSWNFIPGNESERKLYISAFLANNDVLGGLLFLEKCNEDDVDHFLDEILRYDSLDVLLAVNWGSCEKLILERMSNSENNLLRNAQILYFVIHCRNSEACLAKEQMNSSSHISASGIVSNKAFDFLKTLLPPVAMEAVSRNKRSTSVTLAKPNPLSSVKINTINSGTTMSDLLDNCVTQSTCGKRNSFLLQPLHRETIRRESVSSPLVKVTISREVTFAQPTSELDSSIKDILSTPTIKKSVSRRTSSARSSACQSPSSILKAGADFGRSFCASHLLGDIGLKPQFTGVDSPGGTPLKMKFAKTPMPKGRITQKISEDRLYPNLDDAFVDLEYAKQATGSSDNEITFRTSDQSVSSTELTNATLPVADDAAETTMEEDEFDYTDKPGEAFLDSGRVLFGDDDMDTPTRTIVPTVTAERAFPIETGSGDHCTSFTPTKLNSGHSDDISFTYSPPVVRISNDALMHQDSASKTSVSMNFEFAAPTAKTSTASTTVQVTQSSGPKSKYWEYKPPISNVSSSTVASLQFQASALTSSAPRGSPRTSVATVSPKAITKNVSTPSPRRSSRVYKKPSSVKK